MPPGQVSLPPVRCLLPPLSPSLRPHTGLKEWKDLVLGVGQVGLPQALPMVGVLPQASPSLGFLICLMGVGEDRARRQGTMV